MEFFGFSRNTQYYWGFFLIDSLVFKNLRTYFNALSNILINSSNISIDIEFILLKLSWHLFDTRYINCTRL